MPQFTTEYSVLARYIRCVARFAEIDGLSQRACFIRDREFLDALRMLRRVIVRDRREGTDAWDVSIVPNTQSTLSTFLTADASLSYETLQLLLNSSAHSLSDGYTRVMASMPPDVATFFLHAYAGTLSINTAVN